MHVLGILGAGDRLEGVLGRITDRLSVEGRVGVVRYDATIADGTPELREPNVTPGGDVTYELGADGDWTATGTDRSVGDILDELAVDCAYAVVVGVDSLSYPTVAVGDTEPTDTTIATVDRPDELDVDALLEELHASEPHETLGSLVDRVKAAPDADRAGAIATFTGRVRAKDDPDDERTEFLEFEKYEGVAEQRLRTIREELEAREGVFEVELFHRTGVVTDGEDIVFVVVLAGHREEAFRTVEDGINRLKDEVPLFKKEVTVDDEFWVHERQ